MRQHPRTNLYLLLIRISAASRVAIGALGCFRFPLGDFIYVGSARRGLEARVARHLRRRKPIHWHIDHLTTSKAALLAGAVLLRDAPLSECELSRSVAGKLSAGVASPVPRFGTGDCREQCPSHLWRASRRLTLEELARFARSAAGASVEIVPRPPAHRGAP